MIAYGSRAQGEQNELSLSSSSPFVIDRVQSCYLLGPNLVSRSVIYISVGQILFNVHTTVKCTILKRPTSFLPRSNHPHHPHPPLFPNNPLPSLLFGLDFKRCICSPWVERITMTIKNQKRQRPCNDWTSSFEPYWRGRGRRKRRTTHPDAPQLRFIVRMLLIRILRKECYFRWK